MPRGPDRSASPAPATSAAGDQAAPRRRAPATAPRPPTGSRAARDSARRGARARTSGARRARSIACARPGRRPAARAEPLLDRRGHLGDADVAEAPARLMTPALVVAPAGREARDDDVLGQPRPVPLGIGRAEQADDRRPDGRGEVNRPGIARHHSDAARDSASRSAIAGRRRWVAAPSAAPTTARARSSSPGPHSTTDRIPRTSRRNDGELAEPLRRPALVGPRRAGIQQRERPSAVRRAGRHGRRRVDVARTETRPARSRRRSRASRCRFLWMTWRDAGALPLADESSVSE